MDRVRWIKTDEEVTLIRKAADLLDDAYLEAFSRIRPGDTERKVHADLMGTCLRLGFEWAHGILNVFRNTVPYGGESDMVIEHGRRDPHRLRRLPAELPRPPVAHGDRGYAHARAAPRLRDQPGSAPQDHRPLPRRRERARPLGIHDGRVPQGRLARPPHADRPRRRPLVAPAGADPAQEERARPGEGHGAGARTARELLARAGHGAGDRRSARAAVAEVQRPTSRSWRASYFPAQKRPSKPGQHPLA